MKKIAVGLGLVVVFLIAFFWARSGELEDGGRNEASEAWSSSNLSEGRGMEGGRGEAFRGLKANEYMEVWKAVPELRLKKRSRGKLQREILLAWAEVDFKGAVAAAMGEAWDDGQGASSGGIEHHLGMAFGNAMRERPYEIWAMIEGEEFGLFESALMRTVWTNSVGGKDPKILLAAMGKLDRVNLEKALGKQFQGEVEKEDLQKIWASLKGQKNAAVKAPMLGALTAKMFSEEEILELTQEGGFVGEHAAVALAEKLKETPASMEKLKMAESLPEASRGAFVLELMKQATGNPEVSKAAVDSLLEDEQWGLIRTEAAEEAVRVFGAKMEPEELAAWAVELPQREETKQLFHRGVERYIQKDRDAAWEWIGDFDEGMWRDRAYAEFSQQSLNHFDDAARSEEALNMITDPKLKKLAWSWRRGWENKTGFRKQE